METQDIRAKARELLAQHAAAKGYPGHANWAHAALLNQYWDLSLAERRKLSFHEYVIRELSK